MIICPSCGVKDDFQTISQTSDGLYKLESLDNTASLVVNIRVCSKCGYLLLNIPVTNK